MISSRLRYADDPFAMSQYLGGCSKQNIDEYGLFLLRLFIHRGVMKVAKLFFDVEVP